MYPLGGGSIILILMIWRAKQWNLTNFFLFQSTVGREMMATQMFFANSNTASTAEIFSSYSILHLPEASLI